MAEKKDIPTAVYWAEYAAGAWVQMMVGPTGSLEWWMVSPMVPTVASSAVQWEWWVCEMADKTDMNWDAEMVRCLEC